MFGLGRAFQWRKPHDSNPQKYSDTGLTLDRGDLKPHQFMSIGEPPLSPSKFSPDSGVPPTRTNFFTESELTLRLVRMTNHTRVLPPAVFNPDPGAVPIVAPEYHPFFTNEIRLLPGDSG